MSTTTSLFPVTDALFTMVQTAVTPILAIDGPQVNYPSDQSYVVVGVQDAIPGGDWLRALEGQSQWHGMGAKTRLEDITVYGSAVFYVSATQTFSQCRALAKTTIDKVTNAILADPTVGGTVEVQAGVEVDSVDQKAYPAGKAVKVNFKVTGQTRLHS